MPVDLIALGAAFLTGLLGSVHCVAMCGGIATGFGIASTASTSALARALRLNLGRVTGYVMAGLLVGGVGAGVLSLARIDGLAVALRSALGAVLVLAALRLFDTRGRLGFVQRPAAALWRVLAPLQRRLLPADTPLRQLGLGLLWGWLPCGLSTTMLFAAWLEADALHAGLLMASFGAGTLPAMVPLTWSGARIMRRLAQPGARRAAGTVILCAGIVTLAAPWLMQVPALHAVLAALGCRSLG